jgi:hypothetical protein
VDDSGAGGGSVRIDLPAAGGAGRDQPAGLASGGGPRLDHHRRSARGPPSRLRLEWAAPAPVRRPAKPRPCKPRSPRYAPPPRTNNPLHYPNSRPHRAGASRGNPLNWIEDLDDELKGSCPRLVISLHADHQFLALGVIQVRITAAHTMARADTAAPPRHAEDVITVTICCLAGAWLERDLAHRGLILSQQAAPHTAHGDQIQATGRRSTPGQAVLGVDDQALRGLGRAGRWQRPERYRCRVW